MIANTIQIRIHLSFHFEHFTKLSKFPAFFFGSGLFEKILKMLQFNEPKFTMKKQLKIHFQLWIRKKLFISLANAGSYGYLIWTVHDNGRDIHHFIGVKSLNFYWHYTVDWIFIKLAHHHHDGIEAHWMDAFK